MTVPETYTAALAASAPGPDTWWEFGWRADTAAWARRVVADRSGAALGGVTQLARLACELGAELEALTPRPSATTTLLAESPVGPSLAVAVGGRPPVSCFRCLADPQPPDFGSPRRCAFDGAGQFTPDNWNCATVEALYQHGDRRIERLYGNDESLDVFAAMDPDDAPCTRGWWIVTRYKSRGRTSSCVYVGDFWPPVPATLAAIETELRLRRPAGDRA